MLKLNRNENGMDYMPVPLITSAVEHLLNMKVVSKTRWALIIGVLR